MARIKLAEYTAKKLLIPNYLGKPLFLESLEHDAAQLDATTNYIVKVDQGIKKRGKQGLIKLNVTAENAEQAVQELAAKGYRRFIAEPMLPHADSEEKYVSFERGRDGIKVLYSEHGGIDVEAHPESIGSFSVDTVPLPRDFVSHIVDIMNRNHFSFLEINPLVIQNNVPLPLDAAVLADSAGAYQSDWGEDDVVEATTISEDEHTVKELNDNSPAAFTFRILNPDGAIWLLLSGGGASITIADEAMNMGHADLVGNYGEYSGGPTTEESYLYAKAVLTSALKSKAPRKAIVIAGGVANFTDVAKTFKGLIRALDEIKDELKAADVKVFVRRGGPNEKEGLKAMETFLKTHDLYGSVHGSSTVLTDVIHEAIDAVETHDA